MKISFKELIHVYEFSDPYYHERSGFYIGQGITKKSRAGIFRASQGIAVEMTNRIFNLPSFHGKSYSLPVYYKF